MNIIISNHYQRSSKILIKKLIILSLFKTFANIKIIKNF